jgi:geranylgeranyl diphosphate synthase type II
LGKRLGIASGWLIDRASKRPAAHLYDLIAVYPRRSGKGLRAALCFATCSALGGNERQALNSAIAIELFHNAFLIHDDVQDESERRRGGPTLHSEHGVGIAVNVGNKTNLLALRRLMENREILGPQLSWRVVEETERMLRHSLEGEAIELGWIRDNACGLDERDYLHMTLKKTSWYSFIYPLRVGALIAEGGELNADRFCRLGWYFGAAFQAYVVLKSCELGCHSQTHADVSMSPTASKSAFFPTAYVAWQHSFDPSRTPLPRSDCVYASLGGPSLNQRH